MMAQAHLTDRQAEAFDELSAYCLTLIDVQLEYEEVLVKYKELLTLGEDMVHAVRNGIDAIVHGNNEAMVVVESLAGLEARIEGSKKVRSELLEQCYLLRVPYELLSAIIGVEIIFFDRWLLRNTDWFEILREKGEVYGY